MQNIEQYVNIHMIACIDENNAIGKYNTESREYDLLYKLSEDQKFFRETTLGSTIIMGRKTAESLPAMRPLRNRQNIVLTTNTEKQTLLESKGFECCLSIEELFSSNLIQNTEVFVIGGSQLYSQFLSQELTNSIYITQVHSEYIAQEHEELIYFPDIPEYFTRTLMKESTCDDYNFSIYHYVRLS